MAIKINISKLPPYVQTILSVSPAVIIIIVVVFLLILPKQKEIKAFDSKIALQENEIARSQSKVGMLPQLILENEKLRKKLTELQQQLPEEKEVSSLLKQVSDLGIKSGLKILFWKPEQKRIHPSGIVYEIPVKVELLGSYHDLGYFFSSLTKLNRIVNLSNIKLSDPRPEKENAIVKVSFTATTFSAIPEEEIGKGK
jgi:type IV pilus assembly protein PilO